MKNDSAPSAPAQPWARVVPLDTRSTPPPFPVDALPEPLASWVNAEAVATQTPPDVGAMLALTTVAAIVAGRRRVAVKPGWSEPLNLYTLIVLGSGEGKSPVERDALEPVREFQHRQIEAEVKRRRAEPRKNAKAEEPPLPRLLIDDCTPEALVKVMSEQGGKIAQISAEAGVFDTIAGRYARGVANLDVYLKAFSGDPIHVDRITRGSIYVRRPTLTVGLCAQPTVLAQLLKRDDPAGFRGRGLLARFFFSVPLSLVGYREADPPAVPDGLVQAWGALCMRLLALEGHDEPIGVAPDAYAALCRFKAELECRMREAGDLFSLRDWVSKLTGGVARVAGCLSLVNCANSANIEVPEMENAIRIGRYFIDHAKVAFGVAAEDELTRKARRILDWIRGEPRAEFSKRDAFEGVKGSARLFPRADELDAPLAVLCEHGFIRGRPPPETRGRGHPPSPMFDVNPEAHSRNSQKVAARTKPEGS